MTPLPRLGATVALGVFVAFVSLAAAAEGLLSPAAEKALMAEYMQTCAAPERALSDDERTVLRSLERSLEGFCRFKAKRGADAPPVETPRSEARRAEIRALAREAARRLHGGDSDPAGSATSREIATAGTNGTSMASIEQVLFGGRLEKFDTLVLLKDGTARFNPGVPIHDIDPATDRARYPEHWREWRRRDGVLELRYLENGTWTPFFDRTPRVMTPGERGMTLDGKYRFAHSDPYFPGSATFASYRFTRDGRFTASSSDIMGTSTPGGHTATASASCSAAGRESVATTSGSGAAGRSGSSGGGCGAANVGRYVIDGYAIELRAENGETYRRPFYVYGDGTVIIGGRWFGELDG